MKRFGFLLLNALLVLCISCGSKPKDGSNKADGVSENPVAFITEAVKQANTQCPINLGMGNNVTMDSLGYDGKTVRYYYSIDRIVDGFDSNNENMRKSMFYMIKTEADMSPASKQLMNNIAASGGDIVYEYRSADGKFFSIEITNADLKEIIGN